MKLTNKAAIMMNIVAFIMSAYTPIASASSISTDLGTLSLPFGIVTSDNNLAGNSSFSDYWTFTLDTNAIFVGSEVSTVTTDTSEIPGIVETSENGVALSSMQLFNGTANSGSVVAEAFSNQTSSDPIYPFASTNLIYRTTNTYNVFLNNVSLDAGTYTLAVNGEVFGDAPGSFSGSFSLIANNQVSTVPLPSTVWLLGSGLGLLSLKSRRKKS